VKFGIISIKCVNVETRRGELFITAALLFVLRTILLADNDKVDGSRINSFSLFFFCELSLGYTVISEKHQGVKIGPRQNARHFKVVIYLRAHSAHHMLDMISMLDAAAFSYCLAYS